MINFFRKIRKKMVDDNKPMKYMRYAIGEILLVMLGILLALQVNNWNIERQNENVRTSFLVKLGLELDYNNNRLNTLSDFYNGMLERNYKLYDTLLVRITHENIDEYLNVFTFNSSNLNLTSSTFEQMKSTGNLHTLKSDSLLNAIEMYYKLCEREDFYIKEINKQVESNTFFEINKGIRKAQLDYSAKGLDYAIKKNPWLLNTESEEYAEFIRELHFTNLYIGDILNRISRITGSSNNLKKLIRKELEASTAAR